MSNATASEIYENARSRIVNSALGIALGMNSDTSILDASISIEGVENNGTISYTFIPGESVQTFTIPVGYTTGGSIKCDVIPNLNATLLYSNTKGAGAGSLSYVLQEDYKMVVAVATGGENNTSNLKANFSGITTNKTLTAGSGERYIKTSVAIGFNMTKATTISAAFNWEGILFVYGIK